MNAYENIAGREQTLTLSKVVSISERLLPKEMKVMPWKCINHGVELLDSDEKLCAYMVAYGEMHELKCRAALQNFPFERLLTNFEVVDWGCGQGLATLVLLEMLGEHDKEHLVKKVTLIEPSTVALRRAKFNVCQRVNGRAEVVAKRLYLPSYNERVGENELTSFESRYSTTIHLFSNILDIPEVNIERLSQIVAQSGKHCYVVCVGPQNRNSWRIDAFAGYFHYKDDDVFSAINQPNFAHSTRTNFPITCRTRCFDYHSGKTPWDGLNGYENDASHTLQGEYIDDYSPIHILFKDKFPPSLLTAYELIHNQLETGDQLFLRPNINGDQPDIVLYRPSTGLVLFDIKEKALPEKVKNEDNKKASEDGKDPKKELVATVESYANRLIYQHVPSLATAIAADRRYRSLVKTVVVFSQNSQAEVNQYFGEPRGNSKLLLSMETLRSSDLAHQLQIGEDNHYITASLSEQLLSVISPRWHSYRDGRPSFLNKQQSALAVSEAGAHRKIKGVAGSGKTQVMVCRAINAMVRTGQPVLILTYNIALRNYVKYRINAIAADFSWNNVVICSYHEFIRSQGLNMGDIFHDFTPYDDPKYFAGRVTENFAAIFIDEVQDWTENWLRNIHDNFLADNGEFVVFGDKAQNIFHREIGDDGEPRIPSIPGRWNENLDKSERFLNGQIYNVSQAFGVHFFNWREAVAQLEYGESCMRYACVDRETPIDTCALWIQNTIRCFGLDESQTVVLTSTIEFLRQLDYAYRYTSKKQTSTTFAPQELCNTIIKSNDDEKKKERRIEEFTRAKRVGFTMETSHLKLSTISSFKGWESDNVILFIQDELMHSVTPLYNNATDKKSSVYLVPEVIYTAITRARKRLFVINMGNATYDAFFKRYQL